MYAYTPNNKKEPWSVWFFRWLKNIISEAQPFSPMAEGNACFADPSQSVWRAPLVLSCCFSVEGGGWVILCWQRFTLQTWKSLSLLKRIGQTLWSSRFICSHEGHSLLQRDNISQPSRKSVCFIMKCWFSCGDSGKSSNATQTISWCQWGQN